ncbi:MAG: glycosyltransferase family 2 protein [Opitutaceae bacterium]|jgi:glycosyltransferase involved in cell wall biosynthesis
MEETESVLRSWVDEPATATPPSRFLVVRGWCYHRQGDRILAVRARIGRSIMEGRHGFPRPDVLAAFNEEGGGNAGYEIPVKLPLRPCECHLEAQLADGYWLVFKTLPLTPPGKTAWGERWRWLRFWFEAWRGNPAAWTRLTACEHDHVVAVVRKRGWITIDKLEQYPPRPLAEERFPSPRLPAESLPKFTIATPSFNHAAFLETTLRSVLGQKGVKADYIVQDGGSLDGSREIIQKMETLFAAHGEGDPTPPPQRRFSEGPERVEWDRHSARSAPPSDRGASGATESPRLVHWASEPDKGQGDAIRRAFSHASCGPDDLMGYLNSDDLLMPGALRFVAEYFARHPKVDAIYGHRVMIDDSGMEVGRWVSPRMACDDLRLHDLVPQETLFWRKRIWDRVGGIDASFQFALDWDLLQRFRAAGARIERLPWFLGLFRVHHKQKTQRLIGDVGIREMDRLRARALGRLPLPGEVETSMKHAFFDSALVNAMLRKGLRV